MAVKPYLPIGVLDSWARDGQSCSGVVGPSCLVVESHALGRMTRWRSRTLRSRQQLSSLGRAFEVPAKVRLQRSGLAGRWREGILYRDGSTVMFRPRKPRLGSRLDLSRSTVIGTRVTKWWELWWFGGPTVLLVDGAAGAFEVAAANDEYVELARRILVEAATPRT